MKLNMVRLRFAKIIVCVIVADTVSAFLSKSKLSLLNDLQHVDTRRQGGGKGKGRSTSSDEESKRNEDEEDKSNDGRESLDISSETDDDSEEEKKKTAKYQPASTEERHGWRKWHRKCDTCPDDIDRAWRDPGINWVCGGYQRARRSFKSACMMRYRNCQDGTMFVFLHYHRCDNDTGTLPVPQSFGDHFFYDYKVKLLGDDDRDSEVESESASATADSSD